MDVSIKTAGSGAWAEIFSSSTNAVLLNFLPSFRPVVFEEPLFEAAAMHREPLGNVAADFQLAFQCSYADHAAALASIATYAGYMAGKWHFKVVESLGASTTTHYYPNAVLTRYHVAEYNGAAVTHVLTVSSDNVTGTEPT